MVLLHELGASVVFVISGEAGVRASAQLAHADLGIVQVGLLLCPRNDGFLLAGG